MIGEVCLLACLLAMGWGIIGKVRVSGDSGDGLKCEMGSSCSVRGACSNANAML